MKVVFSSEIREIDKKAESLFGIFPSILMENAGRDSKEIILSTLKEVSGKKVVIFCGPGNNGGDGLVVARHLFVSGVDVEVFLIEGKNQSKERKMNLDIVRKLNIPIIDSKEDCDLFVDALLGVGISKPPSGKIKECIEFMNEKERPIISLDIPSGLSADTGLPLGSTVKATKTITFGAPKPGLLIYPGVEYVGKLYLSRISIPKVLFEGLKTNLLTGNETERLLPKRKLNFHKGNCGKILVIAGSVGMTGAAVLCCRAGYEMGAGLVYLGIPESLSDIASCKLTETVIKPLPDTKKKTLSPSAYNPIIDIAKNVDCLIIGPGISKHHETKKLIKTLIDRISLPIILDADGIASVSPDEVRGKNILITPHPKEFADFLGTTTDDIQKDRIGVVRKFIDDYKIPVLLKGYRTIIGYNDQVYINPTGNPGMATGGSGDVLSGMIASLVAQGLSLGESACLGAFLHGLSGDIAKEEKGEYSLVAQDLIDYLPSAIRECKERYNMECI
ncbi:TPA: bifunctional ADP-dependent NAD(P)H-hydrate dehydratase/NAD(P)H-hydrate epimerase [bacterium]|nr:bifunctional ADP-dependent NAD(P)H-hydrate dehydratase/NAD(P)H-hydrate epimerase [bacterium]